MARRINPSTEIPIRKAPPAEPPAQMADLIPSRRGRQERVDPQMRVTGRGRFKLPGSFEWHDIANGGSFVPIGSAVKMDSRGKGGLVDGMEVGPGALMDTSNRLLPGG